MARSSNGAAEPPSPRGGDALIRHLLGDGDGPGFQTFDRFGLCDPAADGWQARKSSSMSLTTRFPISVNASWIPRNDEPNESYQEDL